MLTLTTIMEITVGESRKITTRKYESRELSIYSKANVTNEDAEHTIISLQERVAAILNTQEQKIRKQFPLEGSQ